MGIQGALRLLYVMAAALASSLAVLVMTATLPAQAATDRFPDLRMARLADLQIKKCADTSRDCAFAGQRQLRFSSIIVNVGRGALEVNGRRPDTSSEMKVRQRIYDDAGSSRTRLTTARMYFAGDGHTHWHLRNLEKFALIRLDNGRKVGTGAKHGFCFFDNYNFGSNRDKYYKGCGKDPNALRVRTGLSRGWGDRYGAGIVDQYIDITGLTSGRYRLRATADKANWFRETDNTNNFTWVDIQLRSDRVRVIDYGPAAKPI